MSKMPLLKLRESQIMKIHYLTGICAVFFVAIHILFRLVMPFGQSLEYENVIANYHNVYYVILLELILIFISIHGFNGLRVILLELKQEQWWESTMTILVLAAMIGVIAYGTRTIIIGSGL
ncbi:succinate dehydrogenase [Candidatus Nitrosocosmicus hydrocola]|uniref:succinate dehydrogenase n=1 Tax=Candidatus Nitrosocosmicus hydrocola TaxID=1826872 RepID=UPI001E30CEC0|nr:succinate dehydrogenase [Candidatus Nitrosocosmicus hydrocola]